MTANDERSAGASPHEHSAPGPSLRYAEVSKPEYAERAARTFSVEQFGQQTRILVGPCPRCGATIRFPVVTRIYRGGRGRRPA